MPDRHPKKWRMFRTTDTMMANVFFGYELTTPLGERRGQRILKDGTQEELQNIARDVRPDGTLESKAVRFAWRPVDKILPRDLEALREPLQAARAAAAEGSLASPRGEPDRATMHVWLGDGVECDVLVGEEPKPLDLFFRRWDAVQRWPAVRTDWSVFFDGHWHAYTVSGEAAGDPVVGTLVRTLLLPEGDRLLALEPDRTWLRVSWYEDGVEGDRFEFSANGARTMQSDGTLVVRPALTGDDLAAATAAVTAFEAYLRTRE